MDKILTENKARDYKSKIIDASVTLKPQVSIVEVDADAVRKQLNKQIRKRQIRNLQPDEIIPYVVTQVKQQQER